MSEKVNEEGGSGQKQKPRRIGKYEIGESLGEGTFGKVKRAVNVQTGEAVAIKVLDKGKIQKQNMGSQVKKEISIMKLIAHRTVVRLKEVLASKTKIFIVLELVTGGELFDKIVDAGKFEPETARFYFQQLVVGTMFCHQNGVCHRDLKPENLLLDEFQNLKISDFGLSAMYEGGESGPDKMTLLHTTCGTPNYVAPEVLADKGYDGYKADTWSIGVILFVFLAGYLPFDEPTMSALFRKVSNADFTYPTWFEDDVKDLIGKILVANPEERITLEEITKHPWFRSSGPLATSEAIAAELGREDSRDEGKRQDRRGATGSKDMPGISPGLVPKPSAEDMSKAIRQDEHLDEEVRTLEEPVPMLAVSVNAFDFINACGGAALNRMFLSQEEKRGLQSFIFISPLDLPTIQKSVEQKFLAENGDTNITHSGHLTRAVVPSVPQVVVEIIVKAFSNEQFKSDKTVHLVELHRARGDILQYNEVCERMRRESSDGTPGLAEMLTASC
jgi:serine/threonine protein kinase